jgi:hypothetical protein
MRTASSPSGPPPTWWAEIPRPVTALAFPCSASPHDLRSERDREEIGVVANHVHSPMALFEGDPHGYIIVFVRDTPVSLTSLGPLPK